MWNFRNEVKFEQHSEIDQLAHSQADQEIAELLEKAPPMRFMLISERSIFAVKVVDFMKKSLKRKKRWITRDAKIIIKRFYDAEETDKEVQLFR